MEVGERRCCFPEKQRFYYCKCHPSKSVMKRLLRFFILIIFFTACRKAQPNLNIPPADDWYIMEIKSTSNFDCGVPEVTFITGINEVKQLLNSSLNIYYATGLPDVIYPPGRQLTVKIKKPGPGEYMICTTMGPNPGYRQVVITGLK
jgi:hypothetical protein